MIDVKVNGEERKLEEDTTLEELVRDTAGDPGASGIAVAHNRQVIPRARWKSTVLEDGDRVEVVAPFQGG